MGAGDFFGEIAALTGSPRTADVIADSDTTLLEVPAEALRATMVVPEVQKLILSTLTTRLLRTESADLPRLAGVDQESLRDLRTPRPVGRRAPAHVQRGRGCQLADTAPVRHALGGPRNGGVLYGPSGPRPCEREG